MDPPRNRKQRRAAAAPATSSSDTFNLSSIPLSRPPNPEESRKQQDGKTLLEIAVERQKEYENVLTNRKGTTPLSSSAGLFDTDSTETQFLRISPSGKIETFDPNNDDDGSPAGDGDDSLLPPFIDTLLLSVPLAMLHFTLAFLAAHQYAQEIHLGDLATESILVAFPVLTFILHLAHGHIISFRRKKAKARKETKSPSPGGFWAAFFAPSLRTGFFLPLAIYLGGYLIRMTNEEPYYAVMKRAPAIGTLWVWCVLEMSAGEALLAVLSPLGWGVWYMGYGII
jgi:hypothetical protein